MHGALNLVVCERCRVLQDDALVAFQSIRSGLWKLLCATRRNFLFWQEGAGQGDAMRAQRRRDAATPQCGFRYGGRWTARRGRGRGASMPQYQTWKKILGSSSWSNFSLGGEFERAGEMRSCMT